ncbi:TPA_asm: DUF4376 domain-containing protein [Salmonella enterica subsp. enterica serovar Ank]|uniref:DUF4376 domain-containing protein n=1 Tax=Salmonella enterica subsp. enterica serovar Ank TaxID=1173578 RepID=A0A727BGY6_SALET|nr:DUF4376 domain-containing protein [Salmonella enterica subsp. enterica serovar Ank]
MTTITDARHGRYNENGTISVQVLFSDSERYLPYTAAAHDPTDYGQQLYTDLVAGKYGEVKPFTVTEAMLASARQAKRDEINAWRDAQEEKEYLMTWNGRRWDYGKKTQSRMSTSVAMASRNVLPDGFAWTDGDNNIVPVSAEELIALANAIEKAMFEKGMQINQRQLQMKTEVNALSDFEALKNYVPDWEHPLS